MACSRLPPRQGPHSALDPPGAGVERLIPQPFNERQARPLSRLCGDPVRELRLGERLARRVTPQPVVPPGVVEPPGHPAGAAVRAALPQLSPERGLSLIRRPGPRLRAAGIAHRYNSPTPM